MMEIDTLWEGDYLSIVSPEKFPGESVHEDDVVLVFPKIIKDGISYYGVRHELSPAYLIKDDKVRKWWTVLSGKIEEGEDIEDAAIRELQEESGVIPDLYSVQILQENMPMCKTTDMLSSLVFIHIDEYDVEEAKGDGTELEDKSTTRWLSSEKISGIVEHEDNCDLLIFMMSKLIANGNI